MGLRLSLVAFLVGLSVTAWMSMTFAYGESPCVEACEAAHMQCVEACGVHSNPVECDGDCRERLQNCNRECR